ncbi:MAG: 4-hydroxy-3-methylbut-2-enyl diphosphate reductase [Bacteroidetes bacterium]|nr:4-hydroxy-3-methylbut-2-enyl diphosphate reductase [Bacteroidota bacterium]
MKSFQIPQFYRSPIISRIKEARKKQDSFKKDFSPTLLDFGPVRFFIARHFGFCFGVENAIDISYKAIDENPGKRIFLISQMIHNPDVNNDLQRRGIRFIMDTEGKMLMEWKELSPGDIVIVPAFGTSLEVENKIKATGITTIQYNTTCPFVERVWKKAEKLGHDKFTVIIHGKPKHEETRATFSHSKENAPSLVISDLDEAKILGKFILGEISKDNFDSWFLGRYSTGFSPLIHLQRLGVVNQTTMLAVKTQEISNYIRNIMILKYGEEKITSHFADTRDTLCYATNDNQDAVYALLGQPADLALVVGGYNSSNTGHLAELCEVKLTTYYIASAQEIVSCHSIQHFNTREKKLVMTESFIPPKQPVDILVTSGASCPDATVEEILQKIIGFFPTARSNRDVLSELI